MKVVRWTHHAKVQCSSELVKAIKSYPEYGLPKLPHGARVYSHSTLSPWQVVIFEVEFESLAEYAAWEEELWAAPRVHEWTDQLYSLKERGGGGEFWNVEQFE
jgi:hypothetical protein